MWEGSDPGGYDPANTAGVEAAAAHANPQCVSRGGAGELWSAPLQVGRNRALCLVPNRHVAFLVALANDPEKCAIFDVGDDECGQLGNADSGGVEQLQNGAIAEHERVLAVELVEQPAERACRDRLGEPAWLSGLCQASRRVGGDQPALGCVVEKGPDRRRLPRNGARGVAASRELSEKTANSSPVDLSDVVDTEALAQIHELAQIARVRVDGVRRQTSLHCESMQVNRNSRARLAPMAHSPMVARFVFKVNDSPDPFLTSSMDPVATPEV